MPASAAPRQLPFRLTSPFDPAGDQPRAIDALVAGIGEGREAQVLLGVTGSGKTHTMANVIARTQRPSLVMAHNKVLAAQLYGEFRELFPDNAVEFFVSYYDYYQPEAYVPTTDTFIEKEADINDRIDRLRHSATRSLLERRDVIIVSSVSCIYGLGSSRAYYGMVLRLEQGQTVSRDDVIRHLVEIQYERNDVSFHRGTFRVRGDVLEIVPAYEAEAALRIEFWGDEVESIAEIDALRGTLLRRLSAIAVYPGSHYVTEEHDLSRAIENIRTELGIHVETLKREEKLLEAQRLQQRTLFDLEALEEMGHCSGIENYSRHLTGRSPGAPPPTLLEYFPDDFLMFVDESHVTVPQIGGMFKGDRARKTNLVEHGFRLPSAMDNRPLRFDEWEGLLNQAVFVSATPGKYELERTEGVVVEQIIRPTWLVDPVCEVKPATGQVDDLLEELRVVIARGQRALVTTLTKRMAEDLTEYYEELGIGVRYLHSDIKTLQRIQLINELREGVFDVLVGVNLLREGLDVPEVALVAILDADKEGFLRSAGSLIQTIGRAARNSDGRCVLYADRQTKSLKAAVEETTRRREIQQAWNEEHGFTPKTIQKKASNALAKLYAPEEEVARGPVGRAAEEPAGWGHVPPEQLPSLIASLKKEMFRLARELEFERAAALRDRIETLQTAHLAQS